MKRTTLALLAMSIASFHAAHADAAVDDKAPKDMNYYLSPSADSSDSDAQSDIVNDAARAIGFRGGKAQRAAEIRQELDKHKMDLDYMYNFRTLISSEGYVPPVIVEAKDVAHITNEQIRTANRTYDIVVPARFVSNPPTWKTYLLTGLLPQKIAMPDTAALPKSGKDRGVWENAIRLGWKEGRQGADQIFVANFNRLTRDYTGMLRYSTLLQQNMVKAPVIIEQQQTITGDHNRLMLGDKVKRIKKQAEFDTNKRSWHPTIQ